MLQKFYEFGLKTLMNVAQSSSQIRLLLAAPFVPMIFLLKKYNHTM
jgi:hypothetical protein